MRNTKNTFDLSLDIPLYGDINKLNFCNEYELKHYCFWEGGGDPDADDAEAAESFEAEESAAAAAQAMAQDEFALAFAKEQEAYVNDPSYPGVPPEAFVPTPGSLQPGMNEAGLTAVLSDPEMDDEEDLGFDIGSVPGTGGQGGFLGFFTTPPDKTSMETLATHMSMPSYIDSYTQETETYDPGSTHAGASFFGLNTGLGRGYAADQAQQAAPGSLSLTGLATSLADIAVPGLGSLIGLATNQGTNIGAYGNIAEDVFGYDANQTMDDIEDTLSDFGTEIGLSSLGQGLGLAPTTSNVEDVSIGYDTYISPRHKGGLIGLAEGGMPEDNRVSYTRQNIDTSAGRPVVNWYDRLDPNTKDYFLGRKNFGEWGRDHANKIGMSHDDFIEGGLSSFDPFDHSSYAADQPETDPFTGLEHARGNVRDIRRANIVDYILSDNERLNYSDWVNSNRPGFSRPQEQYRKWSQTRKDYPAFFNAQTGGGIRDLVEDQTTLIDVINTGQAMPPNIGATQAQGSTQPMQTNQPNQQNVYTQSAQPQSFYAQPQQVKNYGNLY